MQDKFQYEQQFTKSDKMWNPDVIGPTYFCIYCFHKQKDYPAYCFHCGHVNTIYKAPRGVEKSQHKCYVHHSKQAVGWCALCARAVCENCDSEGKNPKDYFAYTVNLKCKSCVTKLKTLEEKHKKHIEEIGVCSRHENSKAVDNCIGCNIQLCINCSYSFVTTTGFIFMRKISNGPYCLTCLRMKRIMTTGSNESRWEPFYKQNE